MKPDKGQPFYEWLKEPLDERNVTTARVFLNIGGVLGFLVGLSGTFAILNLL